MVRGGTQKFEVRSQKFEIGRKKFSIIAPLPNISSYPTLPTPPIPPPLNHTLYLNRCYRI
ncbi:MAG: hypothetical protein QNJ68_11010 [Microcoleaceae cyanobacterium MO_207.B10]|nr:hypothetical protein [Microcoleaceae cyanobacterium MO_207.B10]